LLIFPTWSEINEVLQLFSFVMTITLPSTLHKILVPIRIIRMEVILENETSFRRLPFHAWDSNYSFLLFKHYCMSSKV
jgi:hypothetical protein